MTLEQIKEERRIVGAWIIILATVLGVISVFGVLP